MSLEQYQSTDVPPPEDADGLPDGDALWLGDTDRDADRLALADGETLADGDSDRDWLSDADALAE